MGGEKDRQTLTNGGGSTSQQVPPKSRLDGGMRAETQNNRPLEEGMQRVGRLMDRHVDNAIEKKVKEAMPQVKEDLKKELRLDKLNQAASDVNTLRGELKLFEDRVRGVEQKTNQPEQDGVAELKEKATKLLEKLGELVPKIELLDEIKRRLEALEKWKDDTTNVINAMGGDVEGLEKWKDDTTNVINAMGEDVEGLKRGGS